MAAVRQDLPGANRAKSGEAEGGPWKRLRAVSGEALRPGGLEPTKRALELARFPPKAKLLDAACGLGATLGLLRGLGFEATGVDSDPAMLEAASAQGPVIRGSMEALPFGEDEIDGLFCECALNLSESREMALREFHRVLKTGGLLIVSDVVELTPKGAESSPPLAFSDQGDGCVSRAVSLEDNLAALRLAHLTPVLVEDREADLKALSAALVWAYGREGLAEILGLCGGGRGQCPDEGRGQENYTKKFSYHLIIARKDP
jgi:SAM-dependent methyltransferase